MTVLRTSGPRLADLLRPARRRVVAAIVGAALVLGATVTIGAGPAEANGPWTARTAAEANPWASVTYGNGLFVAVSFDGVRAIVASPDGVTWTPGAGPLVGGSLSVAYPEGFTPSSSVALSGMAVGGAQTPVGDCIMAPVRLPRRGSAQLAKPGWRTDARQPVGVTVQQIARARGDLSFYRLFCQVGTTRTTPTAAAPDGARYCRFRWLPALRDLPDVSPRPHRVHLLGNHHRVWDQVGARRVRQGGEPLRTLGALARDSREV
ncbi:MAG: hypothetical protein WCP28_05740 [Actinomycetes bacterium]